MGEFPRLSDDILWGRVINSLELPFHLYSQIDLVIGVTIFPRIGLIRKSDARPR